MSKVNYKVSPIVLLIDMDRTLIGDIGPQNDEYYLIKDINKEIRKVNRKQIRYNSRLLDDELERYIIRPKLSKFLRNIDKYDNIELFVYTASGHGWANYLIPHIEKVTKFKFNRPILTRNNIIMNDKGRYKKSINKVKPLIYKTLKKKKKYNLKNINDLNYITLIDDTRDVLIEKKNQIMCPIFDYRHQIDYLRMIPKDILKIYYIIVEKNFNLKHSTNLYEFYGRYYDILNKHYKATSRQNQLYLNDKYWLNFSHILKHNLSNMSFPELLKILKTIK